jgi:hypothetical protein
MLVDAASDTKDTSALVSPALACIFIPALAGKERHSNVRDQGKSSVTARLGAGDSATQTHATVPSSLGKKKE